MRRAPDTDPVRLLRAEVARVVGALVPPSAPVVVALSGGRDSVVLLDALLAVARPRGHRLAAVHVHHGLSPNADGWAHFCADICAAHDMPMALMKVVVARAPQRSLEATARDARHAALATATEQCGAAHVALAHHRNDQAETLLLQLLRGAGPRGLASMPGTTRDAAGITWMRPLLDVSRATIDAYADATGLRYIDDESNAVLQHRRNAVRQQVMPALAAIFPHPERTLARAAALQADAARLADDLAALDAGDAVARASLDRGLLAALPTYRAANLLRWFLRQQGLPAPSAARLDAMLSQLATARADRNVRILHAGRLLGVHRGRIVVHGAGPAAAFDVPWRGESAIELPHGSLIFERTPGAGLDLARVGTVGLHIRSRAGGERMAMGPGRPRRALKSLLQEAGVPPWARASTPLAFCGQNLAWAAGLGVAADFAAAPAANGITITWHPAADRPAPRPKP